MSVFSEWQPRYAAYDLPVFPVAMVDGKKKPGVRGYLALGADVSKQLALKFPNADAFGFALGRRSRVSVLDVDSHDERVLADALGKFGDTAIIVRSGSGNFQGWFKHNGEGRRIRPFPEKPIDLLGGGYVVAPPSIGSKTRYEFLCGGLDDLDNLPVLRLPSDILLPAAALTATGHRNDQLFRACMRRAHRCGSMEQLLAFARRHNQETNMEALLEDEVMKTVQSVWGYQVRGENRLGFSASATIPYDVIDRIAAANPPAIALLLMLERHNQRRETFAIANAWAEAVGWPIDRLRGARQALVDFGVIRCVHPGGRGPRDPALFAWT